MRVAVLGAGLMGKEVARDLINSPMVKEVVLADVDINKIENVCIQLNSVKLSSAYIDASNEDQLGAFMKDFDIVINALYIAFNELVAKTAIKVGVNLVDLGGFKVDNLLALDAEARAAGITYIPDLGVAPGMVNILSGYGASKLDQVESIELFVGGLPVIPEPPFEYNEVFSMQGVFDEYTKPTSIIRNGQRQSVPSLSGVEPIHFKGFGRLEAFYTPGTSSLIYTFPKVKYLGYKTIRYPGHAEKFKLLVDLNLTRDDYEVEVKGNKVKPRDVFLKVLEPIVDLRDKEDVVLLRARVEGNINQQETAYEFEMITYYDRENKVTAMARSTAYSISVVAQMIGNGLINKKGVFAPEQIVPGNLFIEEMKKREVIIEEKQLNIEKVNV
ncbi:saccharopine dehydrogenase [Neobacillus bataviensis LMG 21833]|uniref:Saccharopine dehydrogenase n=1 Tax=Neobacillus bataviensis LMG 21833 TaxID=1117379 RepID=K6CFP0_9BACI|nr:saccharopine dehydrogenase C-terminal domain-containing protein [Neobacillus bataviensis]EKN69955.1 saccharopine dehydrogenase [Neobacillus bataviensis LMG 21833]